MIIIFTNNAEQQHNLFAYHEVFANSIITIVEQITNGNVDNAKTIIIMNVIYATTLNKKDFKVEELKKMDIYNLYALMVKEQDQAGLIPIQRTYGQSFGSKMLNALKKNGES